MLSQEDVNFIENSLSYEDKVSLIFLLYGHRNPKYALQILAVADRAPASEETSFLVDWMNYVQQSSDWENELLEVLILMEQNLLLLRAGYDDEELRLKYFPRTSEIAFLVHPMLKGLYHLCERLDDANASKLVNQLQQSTGISLPQQRCMETVLLHLLCNENIQLGSKHSGQECNLLMLTAACKATELYHESDFLKSIVSHFNQHISKRDQEQSDATAKYIPSKIDVVSKNNPSDTVVAAAVESNHSPLESYKFHPERAGIVLLINQFSFYRETNPELIGLVPARPLKDRKGTEVDKNALEHLFTDFGYDLIVEENITHHQILQAVQHAVQRMKPIHCSLIVCLLSHGQEGKVFGSNSIPVEVKAIQQLMASERLTGKPKLLIVQACQGADLQSAVPIQNLEHDGLDGGERTASVFMDFLVAWSTVPGFASIRHIEKGSWFIQELCTKVRQLYGSEHIMDILTAVINDVASKRGYGNECMVPIIQSTLSKKFYFLRRA
ncbi:caspase-8 [Anopheles maculipalpis]|uniref:caspase-8 n=1 Tax=Anopheles maculipalpis TaxID=1496333 RepID=UPI002158DC65|nr:caspase-8 [Anopheles maculipalpis]